MSMWEESINNLLYKETYHLGTKFTYLGKGSQICIYEHVQIPPKAWANASVSESVLLYQCAA